MKIKYIVGIFLLIFGSVQAQPLPRVDPVPGGIAIIRLSSIETPIPQAFFEENRVLVIARDGYWHAIVGLPLTLKSGTHYVTSIVSKNQKYSYEFSVQGKVYKAQYITLKNKRMVDPSVKDLERIANEATTIKDAFQHWTEPAIPTLEFSPPAPGRLTGIFGTRRFFNNQPRQPHSGIDIASPAGTPIISPAPGTVIVTGDFFFNGQTIFIDHGYGLISMYNHLRRIDVTPGTHVMRGAQIGEIGSSGRATGPHLHLTMSLNNSRIDPLLFFSEETIALWR